MTTANPESGTGPCAASIRIVPGQSQFDVLPPVFFADSGETYWIRNFTRYRAFVTFPHEIVPGGTVIDLGPKGTVEECKSFVPAGSGVHYYEVEVSFTGARGDGLLASGGSNPRIVFN